MIADRKADIVLLNLDAANLFSEPSVRNARNTFVNFDPPYVGKGAQLYKNSFSKDDHKVFSKQVKSCRRKWIVTYDIDPLILRIYSRYRIGFMDVFYSVGEQKEAQEYVIFSGDLQIPQSIIRANEVDNDHR